MENNTADTGIMYDLSILAELDDPGYVLEMLSLFLSSYPPDLAEMNRVLEEKNWPEMERRAHKLKGSVSILQATKLSSLLATIEHNARDLKNLAEMPQQLEELTRLFAKLDIQLRQEQIKINMG
jgi:HPt (histidine-containing phosphotransfer) domain-containing protein